MLPSTASCAPARAQDGPVCDSESSEDTPAPGCFLNSKKNLLSVTCMSDPGEMVVSDGKGLCPHRLQQRAEVLDGGDGAVLPPRGHWNIWPCLAVSSIVTIWAGAVLLTSREETLGTRYSAQTSF